MKIDFKINIKTQTTDSEIEQMLKDTNRKLNEYKKAMEHEMTKIISDWFMEDELIDCKVKVSCKKEDA